MPCKPVRTWRHLEPTLVQRCHRTLSFLSRAGNLFDADFTGKQPAAPPATSLPAAGLSWLPPARHVPPAGCAAHLGLAARTLHPCLSPVPLIVRRADHQGSHEAVGQEVCVPQVAAAGHHHPSLRLPHAGRHHEAWLSAAHAPRSLAAAADQASHSHCLPASPGKEYRPVVKTC